MLCVFSPQWFPIAARRTAREHQIERVKAANVFARLVHSDLFFKLFAPDLLEPADIVVCGAHKKDDTLWSASEVGGKRGRPVR